jgi:hypothetical protein
MIRVVFILITAGLLATGCASTQGTIKAMSPPNIGLASPNSYTGLMITTTTKYGLAKLTDADRARIVAIVIEKVKEKAPARFAAFNPPSGPDVLHATIAFHAYDEGNAFARFMLAGLGQMHIAADVLLEDRTKAMQIGRYQVTKTFAWGGLYGGMTKLTDLEPGFAEAVAAVLLGEPTD